jgi:hypothetical protein
VKILSLYYAKLPFLFQQACFPASISIGEGMAMFDPITIIVLLLCKDLYFAKEEYKKRRWDYTGPIFNMERTLEKYD